MKILKIKDNKKSEFDKLAFSCGTVFNSCDWLDMFGDSVRLYGIYNKGSELIGGFYVYNEKKYGLSIFRNPPFTPIIGPFLKVEASNPVSVADVWKKTLSLLADFLDNLPYAIISLSFNRNIIDMQPFIWNKFKVSLGYTYILDLSTPIDDLWKMMSNERRKNVNKGTRDNLTVSKVDDFNIVRDLVLKTYTRQGKKTNEMILNKVLFEFAGKSNSFAYATYSGDRAIACSFCIYDKKTAYYLLGGYDNNNKHHGAGAMSMWHAIEHAKKLGLNFFDFEGSMIPKIEKYFRGFGGQLTPYFTINKAKLPLEILLKFYKRELF